MQLGECIGLSSGYWSTDLYYDNPGMYQLYEQTWRRVEARGGMTKFRVENVLCKSPRFARGFWDSSLRQLLFGRSFEESLRRIKVAELERELCSGLS